MKFWLSANVNFLLTCPRSCFFADLIQPQQWPFSAPASSYCPDGQKGWFKMANEANSRICFVTSILLFSTLCTAAVAKTIYVDDDATGGNYGSSWADAYNYLQDALADANSAEKPVEIRVAQGIHKPDQGKNQTLGEREATFRLINGVTLKGGFGGSGEPEPNARNLDVYEVILSGDLNCDDAEVRDPCDLLGEPTRSENSYHVATGAGTDETAVLDGFTVTGGNADGKPRRNTGGGMFNASGSPRLRNCVFRRNCSRSNGGGMFIEFDSPTLTNCVFNGNYSPNHGGGLFIHRSNPVLTNCTFTGNFSRIFGGGISCWTSSPELTGCIFSGNIALNGAGGGIYNQDSNPTLLNCTFAGNWGANSNALQLDTFHSPNMVRLANCILWDGGNEIWQWGIYESSITITYSDVQGGWPGAGNIDLDPLFANPGYWADVNDLSLVVEPNTPNAVWVDGDYHLKSEVGRWDPDSQTWVQDDVTSPCIDAGDPNSDWSAELWPHGERINMGAYGGTQEASMSLSDAGKPFYIQWLGHSTVKVWTDDCVVYVDPERVNESLHDATLVCVTHTHGDHYSPSDIARVSNPQTLFIGPPDVVQRYGSGQPIAPGQTIELDCTSVTAVPAYNTNKTNHPKSRNWVGFVIELGSKRIYVAGDTDLTDEMKALTDIDVAILPAGGTYTMNAVEAAEATQYIKPELAIPYHWGQNVGTLSDAETFAQKAACAVKILSVGETISSDNWPVYSPLIAHWKLDETEGSIAHDSSGSYDGTLHGDPLWQPAGGKADGALEFDGLDDHVSTDLVLNPADGPFSVFAWIKGGAPGQAVISQTGGVNWLCSDSSEGNLMTELRHIAGRVVGQPLRSQALITDGDWHRVGFVWDGSNRILYADGVEIAADTQIGLGSSDGGLYIGTGKDLEPATFFSGLIDDVRIYNEPLSPEDIETLAH